MADSSDAESKPEHISNADGIASSHVQKYTDKYREIFPTSDLVIIPSASGSSSMSSKHHYLMRAWQSYSIGRARPWMAASSL